MFKSARIKLTLWYLLIIMLISLSFSAVIYFGITKEMERGFRRMELRHKAQDMGIPLPRYFSFRSEDLPPKLRSSTPRLLFPEEVAEAKKRILLNLVAINGSIFIFVSIAGYFLAGKTLSPIEKVLEDQKRFIADASHEFKTPLTALRTSIEVALRDQDLNLAEAKKTLKESLEEINNLSTLTDKLLKLSRLQARENHQLFSLFSFNEIIEEALKNVRPLAQKKKIQIDTSCPTNIDFYGEKDSLKEMLIIFLDNAVKYTPSGGKISLIVTPQKNNLIIKVKDTGIGIAEEELPFIFNRFYRADQSRSKKTVSGFGLGLALAKEIIEKHKGKIKVETKLGQGTCFTIILPFKKTIF